MRESIKKWYALVMVWVLTMVAITGCGAPTEKAMKEFKSSDETVSIMLEEDWLEEEMDEQGTSGWIMVGSPDNEEVLMVMQITKGILDANISSVEDLKPIVEEAYNISEEKREEVPPMENLINAEAYTCKLSIDGMSGSGYFVIGETDYAYYLVAYAALTGKGKDLESVQRIMSSFKENAEMVVAMEETAEEPELTDTIKWINGTHAILTKMNGWDYNIYGGTPVNSSSTMIQQQLLNEWWGVTDRQTADENMEWLVTEGHRVSFAEEMSMLEELGIQEVPSEERAAFVYENFDVTEEEATRWAEWYNAYEQYGEDAISGWDYSRAISVLSNYYVAGYYTLEEALDQSLEVALLIQSSFDSWEAFTDSYLLGYEYWTEEIDDTRRAVNEEIKQAADSPYNLDWSLKLEKTW